MIAWKSILLAVGVYKSVRSWDKPADVAEVPTIALMAIYEYSLLNLIVHFEFYVSALISNTTENSIQFS